MTQQEWKNSTAEEKEQEFNRCKNPVYVYNTYFKKQDEPEITLDQYVEMIAYPKIAFLKPRTYPVGQYWDYLKQMVRDELFNQNQLTQGI